MEQKATAVVDFMKMTCGLKAADSEKETICKKFFGQGVQKFKKDNPVAVNDDELRDYAIEIVYNAIQAFHAHNIQNNIHIWRPYVVKSSSPATSSDKSAKSAAAVSKKASNTSRNSTSSKTSSADSGKTPSEDEQKLQRVFETLSIAAKPTKTGMTGLKVDELNRVCEALGGADFIKKIEVVHGKRDKPVKADLVEGIMKLVN